MEDPRISTLKTVLSKIVRYANFLAVYKKQLYKRANLDRFKIAMTHKSATSGEYDALTRFMGSKFADLEAVFYGIENDTEPVDEVYWLSNVKNRIRSMYASKLFGMNIENSVYIDPNYLSKVEYKMEKVANDITEDIFMSLLGSIGMILMDQCDICLGSVSVYMTNIFSKIISESGIKLTGKNIFNSATKMLRVYKNLQVEKKSMVQVSHVKKGDIRETTVQVYLPNVGKPILLSKVIGPNEDAAKKTAFNNAVKKLEILNPRLLESAYHVKKYSGVKCTYANKNITDFVQEILLSADISEEYVSDISSFSELWTRAFTHKSVSEKCNYEFYEFLGDPIVNLCVLNYMYTTMPEIKNIAWIFKIHSYLVSESYLSVLCEKSGMSKYITYDKYDSSIQVHKVYEDVFESFFGCLAFIIVKKLKLPRGCAVELSNVIITNLLQESTPDLSFENIFDAAALLKEIYDSNDIGLKWPSKLTEMFFTKKVGSQYQVNVNAWVDSQGKNVYDPSNIAKNRRIIATGTSSNLEEAKRIAVYRAFEELEKFNIRHVKPAPNTYQ